MGAHAWSVRGLACVTSFALYTCSLPPGVERTRLEDGTFRFRCEGSLSQCLTHVEQVCGDATYTVLSAVDLRRYYGPRIGQYEQGHRSSEAVIRCESRGAPLFGSDEEPEAEPKARKQQRPMRPACVPGATQHCVGVGACSGGQVCLADGTGFGPCQCASAPEPADAGAPATPPPTADAGADADGATLTNSDAALRGE